MATNPLVGHRPAPARSPASCPTDWRDAALCRRADTRLFFPELGQPARPAKAWCAACPVRSACLEHALTTGERWGVWGGATEDERRAMRRTRQVPA